MLKVKLFVHDIELGELTEIDRGYVFTANKLNVSKAQKTYPIEMRRFSLPVGVALYKDVPPIFDEFLEYSLRGDLVELAGINSEDTELERLYKLASLDMHDLVFNIKQG